MKRILLGVVFAAVATTTAIAACPPGTSYNCTQTYNGKMACGCH
jgi:hypothetical protein